jgi:GT2 family glycosyltransferase
LKLSIIILNYNVQYFLELCLKSVKTAIENIDAEVIIVDNNSKDDSCQMIKELFPDFHLIENKENLGFSKGNNIGADQAKGEYLCILNPDTVVAEDTFKKLLKFADQQNNIGIVGCKLIDGKGQFLPESKRNVPVVRVAFQKMIGNSLNYYANHLEQNEIGEIEILVGAFMLMKKSVYDEVNGFDEDYFMYGEDIDLSYKVLNANYHNFYFGETSIIHFKGESTLKDKTYAKRFYKAMQIFYKKHFKKNVFFDLMVWLGIVLAYKIRKETKSLNRIPGSYIVLSIKNEEQFKRILNGNVVMQSDLPDVIEDSEIIFDADYLTYKEIILHMSNSKINSNATFKIHPKNSNFILGSNDSKNRGEVIKFKNNLKNTSEIH